MEEYLTLEQNLCAARVFLNTFGLVLDNVEEVNEFSKIKIFNSSNEEVGELYFREGKVIIEASYNDSILEAKYNIAQLKGFNDIECGGIFGQWSSKIVFQVQKQNSVKLSGEFLIASSADTEFGISCRYHSLINCEVPGRGNVSLKIQNGGSTFRFTIVSEEDVENIDIRPWDSLNGFILHDIINGEYDSDRHCYPYRRYAGVFSGGTCGENKDKLHVFLNEEEDKNELSYHNEFIPKVGEDYSKELVTQKGLLMQQLDPDMFKKIEGLRKLLLIGDVSLLDNLISISYDRFTDEEIKALIGIERKKFIYQNGADNLKDAYFGIGKNNHFLSERAQKRILKK